MQLCNRQRRSVAAATSLIAVLLMVQIWLLSAALEAFLKGDMRAGFPAAVFSGIIFLICLGLYLLVQRNQRQQVFTLDHRRLFAPVEFCQMLGDARIIVP